MKRNKKDARSTRCVLVVARRKWPTCLQAGLLAALGVEAVAVVVHTVFADLGHPGVHVVVVVVAVGVVLDVVGPFEPARDDGVEAVGPVAIEVAVEVPDGAVHRAVLVHLAVAVVVDGVAVLVRVRVDIHVHVVAVGAAHRVGVVAVAVDVGPVAAVAVLVLAVVGGFAGPRVDDGRGVVAVDGRGVPVPVVVGVQADRVGRVDMAVAVVVDAVVAALGLVWVGVGVLVVAVGVVHHPSRDDLAGVDEVGAVAEAVPVSVRVPVHEEHGVVDETVAVVVRAVAALGGARVDARVRVVAVGGVVDVAIRGLADLDGLETVAVAVAIGVGVERHGDVLVHLAVAVVVDAVADLRVAREAAGLDIVAVGGVVDVAIRGLAGLGDLETVAVAVTVRVHVEHVLDVLVHAVVAVVVHAVALLVRVGVDGRVAVVAIPALEVVVARDVVSVVDDDDIVGRAVAVDVAVEAPGLLLRLAGVDDDLAGVDDLGVVVADVAGAIAIHVGLAGVGVLGAVVPVVVDAVAVHVDPAAREGHEEEGHEEQGDPAHENLRIGGGWNHVRFPWHWGEGSISTCF